MLRPTSVVRLYLVRLRARFLQELLAVVGIAIGVALVFSALVANASLTGSVEQLTSGIVGSTRFQLASRGGPGIDQGMLDRVRQLDGVHAAAPILETRAVVAGPKGRRSVLLVGGSPEFAELGGPLIHQFSSAEIARQRAVAMPAPIASDIGVGSFGDQVTVITASGVTRAIVGGRLHEGDVGSLVRSPVMIAPLAYAQQLSGLRGRLTRVLVKPQPGADARVRRGLTELAGGRMNVRAANGDVAVFEQAAMPTNQSTAMFATFAALIGFLFALSAVLLTVPQRRRFIADLRMAGHPPSVIVQLVLFDALAVGVVGVIAGLTLGDVLSRSLFSSVPGYLAFAFPIGAQRFVEWQSVAAASAAGLIAAAIAVLVPVREVFSRRHRLTTPPRTHPRVLLLGGAAALTLAALVLAVAPTAAAPWWGGMVALTIALLCFLPSLLAITANGIRALGTRAASPIPFLALSELGSRSARPRTFALAATGAIAVFASVAIGGAHEDLQRGLDASASDIDSNAAVWATFPGAPNAFATTPFHAPPSVVHAIDRLPGVRSVEQYRGAFLDVGDRRVWVLAPPRGAPSPIPASQIVDGDLSVANRQVRDGSWVAVSQAIADEQRAGIGDALTLPGPTPVRLRIAALSTNLGWPPGAIVMSASDFERAWGSDAPSALHIAIEPDAEPGRVKAQVASTLGPRLPLTVETLREREDRHYAASREGLARLTQIAALVLGAAVLAMATAMAGVLWQRRPMLAGIKVDGIREGTIWRALLLESAVLLGTGCVAGAAAGLAGQVMLSHALEAVTGFPVFYATGAIGAVGTLALVVVVALAVLSVPGWLVVRVPPAPGAAD